MGAQHFLSRGGAHKVLQTRDLSLQPAGLFPQWPFILNVGWPEGMGTITTL